MEVLTTHSSDDLFNVATVDVLLLHLFCIILADDVFALHFHTVDQSSQNNC